MKKSTVIAALGGLHSFLMNDRLQALNATLADEKDKVKKAEEFNKMVESRVAEREKLKGESGRIEKEIERLTKNRSDVNADREKVQRELDKQQKDREDLEAKHAQKEAAQSKEYERLQKLNAQAKPKGYAVANNESRGIRRMPYCRNWRHLNRMPIWAIAADRATAAHKHQEFARQHKS